MVVSEIILDPEKYIRLVSTEHVRFCENLTNQKKLNIDDMESEPFWGCPTEGLLVVG